MSEIKPREGPCRNREGLFLEILAVGFGMTDFDAPIGDKDWQRHKCLRALRKVEALWRYDAKVHSDTIRDALKRKKAREEGESGKVRDSAQ